MDPKVIDRAVQSDDPSPYPNHDSSKSFMVVKRNVTNAKERNRNSSVNNALSILRTLIPTEPRDRKMSKIETLRLAISYIRHLANVIRARTEGDYDGQVCQRYGCTFKELVPSSSQKNICTFCLTDSRRNFHSVSDSKEKYEAISDFVTQVKQENVDYQEAVEKAENYFSNLYSYPEPIDEKWQQSTEFAVKREM